MVFDATLFKTKALKKGKVEQSRERSNTLGVVAIEKGAFGFCLDNGRQLHF